MVKHTITGWEPCADGTAVDGEQLLRFWPSDPSGVPDPTSRDLYVGEDLTQGPSGGCGINKPLVIRMPFKLTRIADNP